MRTLDLSRQRNSAIGARCICIPHATASFANFHGRSDRGAICVDQISRRRTAVHDGRLHGHAKLNVWPGAGLRFWSCSLASSSPFFLPTLGAQLRDTVRCLVLDTSVMLRPTFCCKTAHQFQSERRKGYIPLAEPCIVQH